MTALGAGIAVGPDDEADWMRQAVLEAGGQVVPLEDAQALIWYGGPKGLERALPRAPHLRWVQLPAAGVESFLPLIGNRPAVWTAAKGVYADTCAEQALGLALAGFRNYAAAVRERRWHKRPAKTLFHARVTIVGAGGIGQSLIKLLAPFEANVTVVRRRPEPLAQARATETLDRLSDALADADLVVLAAALTPQTEGMIGEAQLHAMKRDAWLVNVARGKLVKTGDLVKALQEHWIAGAGLDVTDPEPLPDGHPLWALDNCIITSHTANPPNLERDLFQVRIGENVTRFLKGEPLLGIIDRVAGY